MSKKLYCRDKKLWIAIRNISIFLMAFGFVCFFLGVASSAPDYADMKRASITVQSLKHINYYHGNSVYVLKTDDNRRFNIAGDYVAKLWKDHVKPGAQAEIRYYDSRMFFASYIVEMSVDGNLLVRYTDNRKQNFTYILVACSLCELLGAGLLKTGIAYRKKSKYNKRGDRYTTIT
jgi:hypothetical protein